ncbi:MAG TPA: hypothetical protein VK436_05235 [Methanocella sp.]|nr:hypothetical protein [Methanocella sp.]
MMNLLDRFTKDKIEHKVDMTFREIKDAKTPEEVVPLLIELSEFIDQENLTSQQLEEIRGLGAKAMKRHIRTDFLNNIGALISIVTASMIGGAALTILYYLFTLGVQSFIVFVLVPLAVLPIYLLYYGKTQKWFT